MPWLDQYPLAVTAFFFAASTAWAVYCLVPTPDTPERPMAEEKVTTERPRPSAPPGGFPEGKARFKPGKEPRPARPYL